MKNAFRILIIAVATAFIAGCAAMRMSPEEKSQLAENVRAGVANREFTMDINNMTPTRGHTRYVTGFSVKVHGDTLDSALPFFGVIHQAPYGGGKGLTFTSAIDSYDYYEHRSGHYKVEIRTHNDEDNFIYSFDIFDSGSATLTVTSGNRDPMSYTGSLTFE